MGMGVSHRIWVGMTLGVCAVVWLGAQEPPGGRGAGPGRGGAAPAAGQPPAVPQIARSPVVDQAAHDRGRALWASHCIDCHGSQARGSDTGPNIIRTKTVNFDRTAAQAGQCARAVPQGRAPDAEPEAERVVHRRGGGRPGELPAAAGQRHDARLGHCSPSATSSSATPKAGEAYFNGDGRVRHLPQRHHAQPGRHRHAHSRAGRPAAADALPVGGRRAAGRGARGAPLGGRRAGGGASRASQRRHRDDHAGVRAAPISGVLVEESDFYVTLREPTARCASSAARPGMKVTKNNPLQAHIDLLDRVSDKQIHDLVAYLETLK